MRLHTWTPEEAQKELARRLHASRESRKTIEAGWENQERATFNVHGKGYSPDLSVSYMSEVELGLTDIDNSSTDIAVNYVFKNLRFIHSQLSANPPSVVIRPTSSDPGDRRKADAADRLIRYALRQYKMQEQMDRCSLHTLVYGTGFVKTTWDADKGEIVDFNETTGDILMEGDYSVEIPSPWNIYLDSDATTWEEVRYMFERILMPYEEACYRFPNAKEVLEKRRITENRVNNQFGTNSAFNPPKMDVVVIYQYWEKGLPYNGMVGRFCWCLDDGYLLSPVVPNPHRFPPPKRSPDAPDMPARAQLPYHIFTDIDMPQSPWGRSTVAYSAPLQDMLNRIDNTSIDAIQAHGVPRIILPEGTEIADDSITNSPWDIVKITGSQPPHFMEAMPLPQALSAIRDRIKAAIDDMWGVNEAMFGQQSREQSGFSMQYATNQGNMIRRRMFNKYVLMVESVYKSFLSILRKHWDTPRVIHVLGKEKAFESVEIQSADIQSGFDLVVEYGASLSLDPTTRREEIITLMPLFEKAGVETRKMLSLLKLNELDGGYDALQMAADRQREIFEEMIQTGMFIAPRKISDHKNMLAYAYEYVMTSEFKYLPPNLQELIEQHIVAREELLAAGAQPEAGTNAPGPAPEMGAMPPDLAGMAPEAAAPVAAPVPGQPPVS